MRISTRRKFLIFIGLFIMLLQTYKYTTNKLFDWKIELVVFIIGLALFIGDPKYLLNFFKSVITRKNERNE